jgi:hypothetical protein
VRGSTNATRIGAAPHLHLYAPAEKARGATADKWNAESNIQL